MKVNGKDYRTVWLEGNIVKMINQPLLPHKFEVHECKNFRETADAIKNMVTRGAGAIGAAAAYGMAQAVLMGEDPLTAHQVISSARPTANELLVGLNYVMNKEDAVKAANEYADTSVQNCKLIGQHGASLIEDGYNILTHCNAGWLAFVDYGSALAPVYVAHRDGKKIHVFADETRPRCQGSRLTAWELLQEGVPHSIIVDNAAGHYMKKVNLVIVGADRIAANGDVVNKIGTYEKAVLAKHHDVPFYVAAPLATIDKNSSTGLDIPIEERNEDEVKTMFGFNDKGEMSTIKIAPEGSSALNPAFDITPAELVTGYITEKGILTAEEIEKI